MRRAATAGLLLATMIGAPAVASVRHGPAGPGFWSPPARLLPGAHGSVVWTRPVAPRLALKAAARNVLVVYRSVSPTGAPAFVSGTVAIPKGTAPKGGWPIVAYNHGTTGPADRCAPSRGYANWDASGALNRLLRQGLAVVQTDYQGLGTPGVAPYVIGIPTGRDVADMVRAARAVEPRFGRRWAALGVSQGGHATLWTAAVAPRWTPELRLLGAAALAPGSHAAQWWPGFAAMATPSPISVLVMEYVAGASTTGWDPGTILSPAGTRALATLEEHCERDLGDPAVLGDTVPSSLFREGADFAPLVRVLAANDPRTLTIRVPLFVGQRAGDTLVPRPFTDAVVKALRAHGAHVRYRVYQGAGHGYADVYGAYADYARFLRSLFRR